LGRETYCLPLSSADVSNNWSCACAPCHFTEYLIRHREQFIILPLSVFQGLKVGIRKVWFIVLTCAGLYVQIKKER